VQYDAVRTAPAATQLGAVAVAYTTGRQAYTLAQDLLSVTGDRRRFHRRWVVTEQLARLGAAQPVIFDFIDSIVRRRNVPDVPTPWRDDIARLRKLSRSDTITTPRVNESGAVASRPD
jgi:hypothetical protein